MATFRRNSMSLRVKNAEADHLVEALSNVARESETQAVIDAGTKP